MQLLDVVNEDGQVIHQATREECHKKGLRHLSVFIIILNSENKIYLQQRAQSKKIRPGKLTASACGHVHAGEDVKAAAMRELQEELGIAVSLKEIGQIQGPYDYDREIVTIYIGRYEGQITPNNTEIEKMVLLSVDQIGANLDDPELNFGETFKKAFLSLKEQIRVI
jgi:isopentenyldiphosphate isomerase